MYVRPHPVMIYTQSRFYRYMLLISAYDSSMLHYRSIMPGVICAKLNLFGSEIILVFRKKYPQF